MTTSSQSGRRFHLRRFARSPLWTLLGLGAILQFATCSDQAANGPDAPFRVVFISDTHLIGPQYQCCSESPGVDNASIIHTRERFAAVRNTINAMTPRPDMIFVLGDVMHAAYHSTDPAFYDQNETAFSVAAGAFAGLAIPVHFVWGNHDYDIDCGHPERSYPRELSHQLFEHFFATPPYQAVDHKGWKFILTNGMLGRSWDATDPTCDTSFASYGPEQLTWIESELAEGKPSVVLAHYPVFLSRRNEAPGTTAPDLWTLLAGSDTLRATFVGHMHRWIDLATLGTPHEPEWVVAATRYDVDNFWLVEFDPALGTFEVLDQPKGIPFGTCAHTWSYDGTPAPVDDEVETGDCVVGLG
jgi:predicted MPP superfamily phosphohydrolase